MGIHQCPLIIRSCKWLDINSFILTSQDVLRYLGPHWHQWWYWLALVNDIHQWSIIQWILSDVRHRYIYSHNKNCTIGFCSGWRLYTFHDTISSFTAAYFSHMRLPQFYFQFSSFISSNQATVQISHFAFYDSAAASTFLLHKFINFLGKWRYM